MTLVNYECGMLKGRRPDYHPMDMLQFVYFRFGASHTLYIYIYIDKNKRNFKTWICQGGIKCGNRGTGFLDSEGSHR